MPVPIGRRYPLGLLVVQNGEAPEPDDTGPVNGYEFDGSTQFVYVEHLVSDVLARHRTQTVDQAGPRTVQFSLRLTF